MGNTWGLLHPDQLRVGVRAISFLLPRPKNQGKIHDASQIKQPKEEGGRGPRRCSQEDQAARERRPERQAEEERDAGEEGCRQGKEIGMVKVCVDTPRCIISIAWISFIKNCIMDLCLTTYS